MLSTAHEDNGIEIERETVKSPIRSLHKTTNNNVKSIQSVKSVETVLSNRVDSPDEHGIIKSFHETDVLGKEAVPKPVPLSGGSQQQTLPKLDDIATLPTNPNQISEFVKSNKDSNKIRVKCDDKRNFTVYLNQRNIGELDVYTLIKCLTKNYNISEFLKEHEQRANHNKGVICSVVVKTSVDKQTNTVNIDLNESSTLMNNLHFVMELNNALICFEKHDLATELAKVADKRDRAKLENIINQFMHMFMVHTLKVLHKTIIENGSIDDIKKMEVIKYSTNLVYRISKYALDKVKELENDNREMGNLISSSSLAHKLIDQKLDQFEGYIQKTGKPNEPSSSESFSIHSSPTSMSGSSDSNTGTESFSQISGMYDG